MISYSSKACPFMAGKDCLLEHCIAWKKETCRLIPQSQGSESLFDQKLRKSAPLMYRALLDLVSIMENTSKDCGKCGPELWNYAQEVRTSVLDELIKAQLAEAGIREDSD